MQKVKFFAAAVALAIFFLVVFAQCYWSPTKVEQEVVERHLRFTLEITNASSSPALGSEIEVAVPIETPNQRVSQLTFSVPVESLRSLAGMRQERLGLGNIAPYGSTSVKIDVNVELVKSSEKAVASEHFLQPSSLVPLQHPVITKHAALYKSEGHTPESYARRLSERIEYTGYAAESRGAVYALEKEKGDCTEYSAALLAVLRANDIPARMVIGIVVEDDAKLVRSADFHNWVEYFDGYSWVGVDPQFGKLTEFQNYIVYQVVDDINTDVERKLHQRFFSSDSNLKVRML